MGMILWESHGNGNRTYTWGWEWEGMGICFTEMGGSGNVKKNLFSIISTPQESVSSPAFGSKSDTKRHGNNSRDTHKTTRNSYTHGHVTENDTLSFFRQNEE